MLVPQERADCSTRNPTFFTLESLSVLFGVSLGVLGFFVLDPFSFASFGVFFGDPSP